MRKPNNSNRQKPMMVRAIAIFISLLMVIGIVASVVSSL